MKRRLGRELTLKILYQSDSTGLPLEQILVNTFERDKVPEDVKLFITELSSGTLEHLKSIDETLNQMADNWTVDRMAMIDRNILRSAIFEIMHKPETPSRVIINEAIEIAKKYGDIKSYQFINGILDTATKKFRANE
jgi:transcription antitermination protein NusB